VFIVCLITKFMTAKNSPAVLLVCTFRLSLALTLACFVTAQAATNKISAEQGVLRATLTNGLQVIIVRNTLRPSSQQ